MESVQLQISHRKIALVIFVGALSCCMAFVTARAIYSDQKTAQNPPATGMLFDTPAAAADALILAAERNDMTALKKIFGPAGADIVSTGDEVADKNTRDAFVMKAREKKRIVADRSRPGHEILYIGVDDWPFPIPLAKQGSKWYFDTREGRDEILVRRIGSNELNAINVCRGYVEAQKEYATEIHDGKTPNQYAQRMISTPGKHDGLYWKNSDGSSGGPISEIVAAAIQQGYTTQGKPFHGYYFKILKGQGPAASMGEMDFVVKDAMIGGFALVAAPAQYRVTGVKTFIVSNEGTVCQKDLGPNTLSALKTIERYNPDSTWKRIPDTADSFAQ